MTQAIEDTDQELGLAPADQVSLAGFSASTPLARRLVASRPEGLVQFTGVPMLAHFTVEEVDLVFLGARHVPTMRIEGRLGRLVPANPEVMPYGIGEIILAEDEAPPVSGDYPFTTEQIQTLVDKGLYMEGFGPPADWVGAVFEVDAELDLNVLPPARPGTPPLVIVDCSPMASFDMRQEISRYELTQFFPDHRGALIEAGALTGKEALGPEMQSGPGVDLRGFSFGDEQVEAELHRGERDHAARLSELTGVELTAPRALAALRMSTQSLASRAERARQELLSPAGGRVDELFAERVAGATGLGSVAGLTGLSGLSGLPDLSGSAASLGGARDLDDITAGQRGGVEAGAEASGQELSEAVADLDLSGFEGLDLSGFSFGDEDEAPAEPAQDQTAQQAAGGGGRHRQPESRIGDAELVGAELVSGDLDHLSEDADLEAAMPPESDQSPQARALRQQISQRRAREQARRRAQAEPSPLEQSLAQEKAPEAGADQESEQGRTRDKRTEGPELG